MKPIVKDRLILLFKVGLVVALLVFLSKKGFISFAQTRRAFEHKNLLAISLGMMLLSTWLGAIRWQWLLRKQGIHVPTRRVIQLSLIGGFFNVALPGAVSGDLVKAIYIGHESPGLRGRALGSIFFDRIIGLSALVFVSVSTLWIGDAQIPGAVSPAIAYAVSCAAVGAILFLAFLFLVPDRLDPFLVLLQRGEARMARIGSVRRMYEGVRHYHHHRLAVFKAIAVSIVIHLTLAWVCMQFAHALGEWQVTFRGACLVVPLGLLVTAIPVMPAGVGTGHAAFLYLFAVLGSERGADVYTLMALTNLTIGAIGGIVYVRFKRRESMAPVI